MKEFFDTFVSLNYKLKKEMRDVLGFVPMYFLFLPVLYSFPIYMILSCPIFTSSWKYIIGVVIYLIVVITDAMLLYIPSLSLWAAGLVCTILFTKILDPLAIAFYAILAIKIVVFIIRYAKYNSKKNHDR